MATYEHIVFLDGDEATKPIDILYDWQGDSHHLHYIGPTAESINAALDYMSAWDYGGPGEQHESASFPTDVDTWTERGYRLSAHLGLGYIGLERILPDGQCHETEVAP